jgi:nicotinamide-nucleotide amidase
MIEILTIGNEILSGKIVNTNLAFIAKALKSYGYEVNYHEAVGDQISFIQQGLTRALSRVDIVITTGGLGPTLDDLTKQAASFFFEKKLYLDPSIKQDLVKRYGQGMSSVDNQATVPEDTLIMQNSVGTAPGFIFVQGKKRVYILPGVPSEMEAMFVKQALPDILQYFPLSQDFFRKTYCLCHLGENALDPMLRRWQSRVPTLEIGIYPGYGVLSIELFSKKNLTPLQQQQLDEEIKGEFGSFIYSTEQPFLPLALQRQCVLSGKTLFLAESCTGGKIAAHIVAHPGSSKYFLGSCVVYSDALKSKILGVQQETLSRYGAVSEEVVEQMLKGGLEISGADYVLAVSGVAGPEGGSEEKPVGAVVCGLLDKKGPCFVWKMQAKGRGKRENVIEYTAQYILGALWRYIVYHINPS